MTKFSGLFLTRKKTGQMKTNSFFVTLWEGDILLFDMWAGKFRTETERRNKSKVMQYNFFLVTNFFMIMAMSTLLILDPFRNLRTNIWRGKEYRGIFLESDSLQARWSIMWRALWHKQQGISSETLHVKCFHIFLGYQVLMCWDHSVNQ